MREYVVYDMLGRQLTRGNLTGGEVHRININAEWGYYIISAISSENVYTQKVFISE